MILLTAIPEIKCFKLNQFRRYLKNRQIFVLQGEMTSGVQMFIHKITKLDYQIITP